MDVLHEVTDIHPSSVGACLTSNNEQKMSYKIRAVPQMKTENAVVKETASTIGAIPGIELQGDSKSSSNVRAIPNVVQSEEKPKSSVIHAVPSGLEPEDDESECHKCGKFKEDVEHYENSWISCDNCSKWFHGWYADKYLCFTFRAVFAASSGLSYLKG